MKNILITGASGGLGYYLSELLLAKGTSLFVFTRNIKKLQSLKKKYSDRLFIYKVDISSEKQIIAAYKKILSDDVKIDVLVNNAGYGQVGPVENISLSDVRNQFEVNLFSLIKVSQMVLPDMRKCKNGLIVNIGSSAGKISSPFNGIYAASKHALEAISDAMRFELHSSGVKVVLLEPGKLATDYNNKMLKRGKAVFSKCDKFYKNKFKTFLENERNNTGCELKSIGNKMAKIILSDNPKSRYTFDFYTKILFILRRFLPEFLYNYLITRKM